jgi:AAA family ATP:ADP antiporter
MQESYGLRMRKSRVNPSRPERSKGMATPRRLIRERAEAAVASLVAVRPHEIPPLMSAAATFFFVSQPSIHLSPLMKAARLLYAV